MIRKNGFTLVELLVVIAVLSTAGLLVLAIFTNSLRGSNKAQILSAIQKNGRSVLETMDKTIRSSDGLVCISGDSKSLVVVKDGSYTRYSFIDPVVSPAAPVNGSIQQDTPVKKLVSGQEETSAVFIGRICTVNEWITNPTSPVVITDTDPQSGVSITDGQFVKNSSSGFKNQVTINFNVAHGVKAYPFLTSPIEPVNFVTTINLR